MARINGPPYYWQNLIWERSISLLQPLVCDPFCCESGGCDNTDRPSPPHSHYGDEHADSVANLMRYLFLMDVRRITLSYITNDQITFENRDIHLIDGLSFILQEGKAMSRTSIYFMT